MKLPIQISLRLTVTEADTNLFILGPDELLEGGHIAELDDNIKETIAVVATFIAHLKMTEPKINRALSVTINNKHILTEYPKIN